MLDAGFSAVVPIHELARGFWEKKSPRFSWGVWARYKNALNNDADDNVRFLIPYYMPILYKMLYTYWLIESL